MPVRLTDRAGIYSNTSDTFIETPLIRTDSNGDIVIPSTNEHIPTLTEAIQSSHVHTIEAFTSASWTIRHSETQDTLEIEGESDRHIELGDIFIHQQEQWRVTSVSWQRTDSHYHIECKLTQDRISYYPSERTPNPYGPSYRLSHRFTQESQYYKGCKTCMEYSQLFPNYILANEVDSYREYMFLHHMKAFLDHCDDKHMSGPSPSSTSGASK
jgi:hypothetical protein